MLIQVVKKEAKLFAAAAGGAPQELKPTGPASFYAGQMRADLEFTPKPANGMGLRVTTPGGSVEGERVASSAFDPKDMGLYTGTYWSEELETQYTIALKGGRLIADHAHHGEIALTPLAKDLFRGGTWFMPEVKFVRDGAGKVTGMVAGGNRVTGVRFVRR